MKTLIPLIPLSLALISCGTPYQEIGTSVAGGHSFQRRSIDVFTVGFYGNGFTNAKKASDFAKLRAAEVTLEHNFRYFSILSQQDQTSHEMVDMGGQAYTTGNVNSYGGYSATTTYTPQQMPVVKPGKELTIRCYTKPPGGHAGITYDAQQVKKEIGSKYKLNR